MDQNQSNELVPEVQINTTTKIPKSNIFRYFVLILVLIIASSGITYLIQNNSSSNTRNSLEEQINSLKKQIAALSTNALPSPTASATISPTASSSSSPTATTIPTSTPDPYSGWKSYTISDLNVSFKYPGTWPKFEMTYSVDKALEGKNTVTTGTRYVLTGPVNDGQTNIFGMVAYSKNYKSLYPDQSMLSESVNPNWTLMQFNQAKNGKAVYLKKLSNNSLLVAEYFNLECSPFLEINVYSPLTNAYPNLIEELMGDFSKEPEVITKINSLTSLGSPACDLYSAYQQVGARWIKDGLPADINSQAETARLVDDSITK